MVSTDQSDLARRLAISLDLARHRPTSGGVGAMGPHPLEPFMAFTIADRPDTGLSPC
ncbi:hypothetical protein [Streptosporangium vulgare]|uniref:Uncharacterized protein n=1 Tax=Streptosporangium vulgare TaxID=46190 RepID=A0ABV5TWX2_9ACTN